MEFVLYIFDESEFSLYNAEDMADRRTNRFVQWYHEEFTSTSTQFDTDDTGDSGLEFDIDRTITVGSCSDRYIRHSHNYNSIFVLFPCDIDKMYFVDHQYLYKFHTEMYNYIS